jgi:tripartite-type tricarboxylate transporter receptor subunit TctC
MLTGMVNRKTENYVRGDGVLPRKLSQSEGSMIPRRKFMHLAAGATAILAISRVAAAQTYPSRPITMIVPFAAGGAADAVARILAEPMRRSLGQAIIIEDVSGADGSIGVGRLVRARPDGYTIELGPADANVFTGAFYSLQYDLLTDLAPISPVARDTFFLFARKTTPGSNLKEFIAWLKATPNRASAGIGSVLLRVLTVFFQKETGTRLTLVPYRGVAPAIQDLVAGQIDLVFGTPNNVPFLRSGSVKGLATTSDLRLEVAPDLPTFAELGFPALSFSAWFGVFAPKGTPREIIRRLNAAITDALTDPAVRSRLVNLGMDVFPREQLTPEALGSLVRAEIEKWWPIMKEFGIRAE